MSGTDELRNKRESSLFLLLNTVCSVAKLYEHKFVNLTFLRPFIATESDVFFQWSDFPPICLII